MSIEMVVLVMTSKEKVSINAEVMYSKAISRLT